MKSIVHVAIGSTLSIVIVGSVAVAQSTFFSRAPTGATTIALSNNGRVTIAPGYTTQEMNSGAYTYTAVYTDKGSPVGNIGQRLRDFGGGSTAVYHQTIDVYFDGDGNKLATESQTHAVNEYCHPGTRRTDELVAYKDDGKGNVRFTQLRLPSEPQTGVERITQEDIVRVQLAGSSAKKPAREPVQYASKL